MFFIEFFVMQLCHTPSENALGAKKTPADVICVPAIEKQAIWEERIFIVQGMSVRSCLRPQVLNDAFAGSRNGIGQDTQTAGYVVRPDVIFRLITSWTGGPDRRIKRRAGSPAGRIWWPPITLSVKLGRQDKWSVGVIPVSTYATSVPVPLSDAVWKPSAEYWPDRLIFAVCVPSLTVNVPPVPS